MVKKWDNPKQPTVQYIYCSTSIAGFFYETCNKKSLPLCMEDPGVEVYQEFLFYKLWNFKKHDYHV